MSFFQKGLRFITPKAFSELLKLSREYQMLTVTKVTDFRWTRSQRVQSKSVASLRLQKRSPTLIEREGKDRRQKAILPTSQPAELNTTLTSARFNYQAPGPCLTPCSVNRSLIDLIGPRTRESPAREEAKPDHERKEPKTKAKEAPADPKELEKEKAAEQITEVGSESAGDPERLLNRVSKEDSLPNVFRSPRVKKLKRGLSRSRTD
ncbi:hypothetical protein CRG98_042614 [Punica granatum]|uniref:Uncharacterized protein n=1 Tax=Punica granatum TaxID=22663 RepID=A0A2I0HZ57_PUNGR|nr:hypothetical protein CRG98_042614 [Punica granatum]